MTKLNTVPLSGWGLPAHPRLCVIAGPCSAETREQVLETAAALKALGIGMFRAGIWKPRTHPGCFEGAGALALEWLEEVKERYGMKLSCEVATAAHVGECLKRGVDMVWIGARTTANPFQVQEISEALRGVDVPVLVKNPVNPDTDLWVGAFERLNACGVRKLGAVHRGVSTFQSLKYRNDPAWEMAVQLRSRLPGLPLFCDPSHMGGDVKYVRELSQRALDLGFEGLMIETHCHPECALSDAKQQLTPEQLRALMGELRVRNADADSASYRESIDQLRAEIDLIDDRLLALLARRMGVSEQIGRSKKENNVSILQTGRWDAVMERMVSRGKELGLSEEFIRALFARVHEESVAVQNKVLEK